MAYGLFVNFQEDYTGKVKREIFRMDEAFRNKFSKFDRIKQCFKVFSVRLNAHVEEFTKVKHPDL